MYIFHILLFKHENALYIIHLYVHVYFLKILQPALYTSTHRVYNLDSAFINPQCACTMRVMLLGFVCLSVCLSVRQTHFLRWGKLPG